MSQIVIAGDARYSVCNAMRMPDLSQIRAINEMPRLVCQRISTVFTDIDDTLTNEGRLPAIAYQALWRAQQAGIAVVPVTGRPAGWCDHLARMWPVAAVVGENGALAFSMRDGQMKRLFVDRPDGAAATLAKIEREVLAQVAGCKVSADQPYRLFDLAIDYAEEVERLPPSSVKRIVEIFEAHGAMAKVSSIHVNGWFGHYDKLSMCQRCSVDLLGAPLDVSRAVFVGDSPNDAPMFGFFEHSVGVANVRQWLAEMATGPAYVTEGEGGEGFAQFVDLLLERRAPASTH